MLALLMFYNAANKQKTYPQLHYVNRRQYVPVMLRDTPPSQERYVQTCELLP